MARRAESFFKEASTPLRETSDATREVEGIRERLRNTEGLLFRRTAELTASEDRLRAGAARCKLLEDAREESERRRRNCLAQSLALQKRLRRLTRQVLRSQEDERAEVSGKLRDEIAQALLGIKTWLLLLKTEAARKSKNFRNEIAGTQRRVATSAGRVSRLASVLEDV